MGWDYRSLSSSFWSFLHSPIISSLSDLNILNTLFLLIWNEEWNDVTQKEKVYGFFSPRVEGNVNKSTKIIAVSICCNCCCFTNEQFFVPTGCWQWFSNASLHFLNLFGGWIRGLLVVGYSVVI
jgi:hypothetical protein